MPFYTVGTWVQISRIPFVSEKVPELWRAFGDASFNAGIAVIFVVAGVSAVVIVIPLKGMWGDREDISGYSR